MPKLISICLTQEQQKQLEQIRDTDSRPYMRERAAAMLKIAEGISPRQVALNGLHKYRKPDTVYEWVHRYQQEDIAGLVIKSGRGRKPAYWPRYQDKDEAKKAILHTVRRDPSLFDNTKTRWELGLISQVFDWLAVSYPSSLSQLLKRLGISYKRGKSYIHSPDPHYEQKMDMIAQHLLKAWYAPEKYALLYQDEFTIYRQPTVGRDYEQMGKFQPLARMGYGSNTELRGIGALNAITGQVTYHQTNKGNIKQLTVFYDMVTQDYTEVDTIYMVQDNSPVHFHPDLLIHLQSQDFQFPMRVPGNWPDEPSPKAKRIAEKRKANGNAKLPIKIIQMPTYAPWANPIEKLWRWVRQSILHLHRLSHDWSQLKLRIRDFILSFRKGSNELLRYVGLLPD